MTAPLLAAAEKVQQALRERGVDARVVQLDATTRSAADAAAAIGCGVGQIAKSLVFRSKTSGRPVLVVASGVNRVSERTIAALLGEAIEKADAAFVRDETGFAIGGVPPIAHHRPIVTFIDQDLLGFAEIWAAAGTPNAVFRLTPADLLAVTGGQVIPVT